MAPVKSVSTLQSIWRLETNALQNSSAAAKPTRPRLQSINQDFTDLTEQVAQAAQILGLPEDWENIIDEIQRSKIIQNLVRARAEWVLRWVLDKLKDESDNGQGARRNTSAWKLLDWMIHILPASRSAPHLRDAGFPSILERTLFESFDNSSNATTDGDVEMVDAPEVNGIEKKNNTPSRKRKRGMAESPGPRTVTISDATGLFHTVKSAVESILGLTVAGEAQNELMKMVLRTESPQAARILRFWLQAVYRIAGFAAARPQPPTELNEIADLSIALQIWDLRVVETKDESGVSADDFSTECLVPTLLLLHESAASRKSSPDNLAIVLDQNMDILDKLLSRHLIVPSRSAYFAGEIAADTTASNIPAKAVTLLQGLEPLRAKFLQAAQIQDLKESLPGDLEVLFQAVPHILELAIRVSPAKTPKSRLAERPWFQATFAALAECVGCSLDTAPIDLNHNTTVAALEASLRVLHNRRIDIGSAIPRNLFKYHCGVQYPEARERTVHWSLIASLIQLDGSVFVAEPKKQTDPSTEQDPALTDAIFEHISSAGIQSSDLQEEQASSHAEHLTGGSILSQIIVPLMTAFVQNRNLLGFVRRWDDQLTKTYSYKNRKALEKGPNPVWSDRKINKALAEVLEQSLTPSQIVALLQEHAKRIVDLEEAVAYASRENTNPRMAAAYKNAASSEVILPALLQSIRSDESIDLMKSQLLMLLKSYAVRVTDDNIRQCSHPSLSWFTLCQLVAKLWPSELHRSSSLQRDMLLPLVERAASDLSATQQGPEDHGVEARAAAMLFVLDTCKLLETIPGTETLVQKQIRSLLKAFSSNSDPGSQGYRKVVEIFCSDFVTFIAHQKDDSIQKSISTLLAKLAKLDTSEGDLLSDALSRSMVEDGNLVLKAAFYKAILEALSEDGESQLRSIAAKILLKVQPAAIPRETREAILDCVTEQALSQPANVTESFGIMVHLMSVPNASAQVCTNGKAVVKLAQKLQDKSASRATLELFRILAQSIFSHVLPNKEQAQGKKFLAEISKKLGSIVKASSCSAGELSVLRAAILAQKEEELLNVDKYVKMLKGCLTADDKTAATMVDVLEAITETPLNESANTKTLNSMKAWLLDWINDSSDFGTYMASSGPSPPELSEHMVRVHAVLAQFRIYPNAQWLVALTLRICQDDLTHAAQRSVRKALQSSLSTLSTEEKLDLIPVLTGGQVQTEQATLYSLLTDLITTFEDKLGEDVELKSRQLALLPRLCDLLSVSPDYTSFNTLLSCINNILNDKSSLASQCSIESVLGALNKLTSRNGPALPPQHAADIYSRLCETTRLVLLVHRGRLGGRFHLFLPLLRSLLFCLFIPNGGRSGSLPPWLRSPAGSDSVHLTPTNATQYTRLVTTLCSPPQSSITKAHHYQSSRRSNALNDPVRAAREKTSHFLYPLLASFCRFQLNGRLDAKLREKLMPGVWEVVGTASLHREALDAMFAGLASTEKDVWRGVWGEWEEVHGRKSRAVAVDH